jgi:ribose transport system ATP-binding protein
MQTTIDDTAVSIEGVSKTFGTTRVLRDVCFSVRRGEIHAFVGENGSGKSTLVKVLSGFHAPDTGSVVQVDGRDLPFEDPVASASAGLRFVHQDLGLVLDLSTVENLALGRGYKTGAGRRILWRDEVSAAKLALSALGYDLDVTKPVSTLSPSERTAVAIARAVAGGADRTHLLVLDEPTVNLPAVEVARLFTLLRRLRDSGVAILYISHHFDEIFALADRVTVLRDGAWIATEPVAELDHDRLVELMLGRVLSSTSVSESVVHRAGDVVLEMVGVTGERLHGLDLTVHAGEVVGIAGITGSGREQIARMVSCDLPFGGRLTLDGRTLRPGRTDVAFRSGLAYVPSDRRANAVLPEHTIRENTTISNIKPYMHVGFLSRSRERTDVAGLLETFDVRPRRSEASIGALSGGNQQKVMIARALRLKPRLLVLDEPTQGVDIGAQAEIHRLVVEAAAAGAAVLVCSSVSEELATICDRVVVLNGGQITAVLQRPINSDQVTAATLSVREENKG